MATCYQCNREILGAAFTVELEDGSREQYCSPDHLPVCSYHEDGRETPMCEKAAIRKGIWGDYQCAEHAGEED